MKKSTIAEIRERFDKDVERFSNLETGQVATIDATLSLELITEAAKRVKPKATHLLDLGCGAGNYTLKMLQKIPDLHCTMIDLSGPMLTRAAERIASATKGEVKVIQGDMKELVLPVEQYDIVLAGAVLHHLREEKEWEAMFEKLFNAIKKGGCLFISDLVEQDSSILNQYTWEKYGEYLEGIGGSEYRTKVLAYIEKEDSPRSLFYQLDLLRKVGFGKIEILNKNLCFAAFGAIKA